MDVHYSDHLEHVFVVSPDHLKKLVELLQNRIGKVNISADCIDKIQRKFNTVKDLIAYENSKSKRIHRLHLDARSDDYSKSARIVFGSSFLPESGVSINIDGREDVVSRLKEKVLDVLSGMRPWYNWIARANLVAIFGIGYFTLFFIFLISILFEWIPVSDSPTSTFSKAKETAMRYLFFLVVSVGLWGLHKLRSFLFPKLTFTIGQEESRFRLLEKIRWGVVITFGVSLAASLVVPIITIFF